MAILATPFETDAPRTRVSRHDSRRIAKSAQRFRGAATYDVKGNLVTRPASLQSPALSLVWDFDNKLRGADTNGTPATLEVTYEYDALGRRVARSGPGGNVVYFQAGQQTIADYPRGGAPASATYRYVYGSYIDEPLLRETVSGSVRHFFHRNQQYSITALTDSAGNTAERYAYTAYGALTVFNSSGIPQATSPLNNRYTYTGREWDDSTKLYHFRARWFDIVAGRFVGRDPLGFTSSLLTYANDFFMTHLDPSGNCAERVQGKVKHVPGRGYASLCSMAPQGGDQDLMFGFGLNWKPIASEFQDEKGCACCDKVGVIQIVKAHVAMSPNFLQAAPGKLLEFYNNSDHWEIDSHNNLPAYQGDGEEADPTNPSSLIRHYDSPGFPYTQSWYLGGILKNKMVFETCIVCLEGKEGFRNINYDFWDGGKGIILYGCYQWGYEYEAFLGRTRHRFDYTLSYYMHVNGNYFIYENDKELFSVKNRDGKANPRTHMGPDVTMIEGGPPSSSLSASFLRDFGVREYWGIR